MAPLARPLTQNAARSVMFILGVRVCACGQPVLHRSLPRSIAADVLPRGEGDRGGGGAAGRGEVEAATARWRDL